MEVKEGILLGPEKLDRDAPQFQARPAGFFRLSGWKAIAVLVVGIPLFLIMGVGILAVVAGFALLFWILRPLLNFLFGPGARE